MWNKKDFIGQKQVILKHFENKGFSIEEVANFSTMVGIPLIVVYEFIAEEMPEHRDTCFRLIKVLKEFYGIKE